MIWLGGYQVIAGALSLGQLVAFNTYLALLTMPLMMIGMITAQLTRAAVRADDRHAPQQLLRAQHGEILCE